MHRSPRTAAAVAAAALLVPAAAAQAATKHVSLGLAKPPAGSPAEAGYFDFFPRHLTVHRGDRVSFKVNGFGVVFAGPKSALKPFVVSDASHPVSGVDDPAGQPFWFNGRPSPRLDPSYLQQAGDGKVRRHGVDSSGISFDNKPYVLRFVHKGTFTVRDGLHPDRTLKVKVVGRHHKATSKAAITAATAKQAASAVEEAKRLQDYTPPAGTISVGHDSKRVGLYQFLPGDLHVQAGTPVTVTVGGRVNDVHDLAIGPDAFDGALSANFFPTIGQTGGGLEPAVVFPSQATATTTGLTFAGAATNGGFVNTGLLDADAKSPLPGSVKLTFTQPGTYHYVCLLHSSGVYTPGAPQMQGTITVQ